MLHLVFRHPNTTLHNVGRQQAIMTAAYPWLLCQIGFYQLVYTKQLLFICPAQHTYNRFSIIHFHPAPP